MKTHFPFKKFCRWFYRKINRTEKATVTNHSLDEIEEYKDEILDRIKYIENDLDENALRLRGGGGVEKHSSLIQIAIDNAKKHGINLQSGVLNRADGNCAFDAVINNINHRSCFFEKLSLPSSTYRQIWVTELESESKNFPSLGAGYTEDERNENWNRLKESGVYEIDFFLEILLSMQSLEAVIRIY